MYLYRACWSVILSTQPTATRAPSPSQTPSTPNGEDIYIECISKDIDILYVYISITGLLERYLLLRR